MPTAKDLPSFDECLKSYDAHFWGEKGTIEEGKGMLNLLTPEVKLEAAKEIKDGHSFGLNWDMRYMEFPAWNRKQFEHKVVKLPGFANCYDDEYQLNPQSSSQWDGFRHWAHSKTGHFFSGITPEEIEDPTCSRMGIGHWAQSGIAGRGILFDYKEYAKKRGIEYQPFEQHPIPLSAFKEFLKEHQIELRPGDILFLRTGYTAAWESFDVELRKEIIYGHSGKNKSVGIEQSEEWVRFLWDQKFSAICADTIGVECFPFLNNDWIIHDHALATFGMPLGEMWHLESLGEHCAKTGRYTFFLSGLFAFFALLHTHPKGRASAPFNMFKGVSSVPNAVAFT